MVDQKREARKIPVQKVSSEELRAELDGEIRKFEHRFERPSERMLQFPTFSEVLDELEFITRSLES